ncbi:putative apyrase 6 [Camellia lanceoleosa]|uniref:Apyrase 6 n=1 Tax=Camellia lanceoleosa TaxID=1840588 RepID=A0ACC0IBK4_9ERIC|nr:putative apyrase 6 [Camellia lanceoleosa]
MDLSKLQSRVSSSYIPPHRTQLHPRTILYPNPRASSSSSSNRDKCLILFASLFVFPFLFYLFYTALGVHQSSKFGESKTNLFGIIINASPTHSRIHVFEFLNPGSTSLEVKPGLSWFAGDPEGAGRSVVELIEFAKKRVPKSEWRNTKVQLMGSSELERVELVAREAIFESCRRVLWSSGFLFKNEWLAIMEGREEALYAWVAANYALGSLGGEPQDTTGIVELGGASLQDAIWESLCDLHNSKDLLTFSSSREDIASNPCIPRGYDFASNASDAKLLRSYAVGNFSACKSEMMALLRRRDICLHPPCERVSSSLVELQSRLVPPDKFFFISEFFGLAPTATLSELEAAGHHYCEDDWYQLKRKYHSTDDLDLLRYCFSSAYVVALLHDSFGIPMTDKRIRFGNQIGVIPVDWTLGAFILQTIREPLQLEPNELGEIVGNDAVTYFSLFAVLLIMIMEGVY